MAVNLVGIFQFLPKICVEFRGHQEAAEFVAVLESNLVTLGHHAEKRVQSLRYLILGAGNGDNVTGLFGTWKVDLAIPFLFKLFDFRHTSNELTMVEPVDDDGLRDELGVLGGII